MLTTRKDIKRFTVRRIVEESIEFFVTLTEIYDCFNSVPITPFNYFILIIDIIPR